MKDSVPYGILILHADFFTLPVFFLFMFSLSLTTTSVLTNLQSERKQ